jgi:hypothetical protein
VKKGKVSARKDVHVEDDDCFNLAAQVVLCQDRLTRDFEVLDLDVDAAEAFAQGVDLDKSRVDGLVEFTEASDQSDGTLVDLLERIRAAEAAGDGAEGTEDRTLYERDESVYQKKDDEKEERENERGSSSFHRSSRVR